MEVLSLKSLKTPVLTHSGRCARSVGAAQFVHFAVQDIQIKKMEFLSNSARICHRTGCVNLHTSERQLADCDLQIILLANEGVITYFTNVGLFLNTRYGTHLFELCTVFARYCESTGFLN